MLVFRRSLTLVLALAAVCALALPAAASAAKKAKLPEITRVTPMRTAVGAKLTIRGKNFKTRKSSNTVVFRASNGRSAFAKPISASKKKLVVKVPVALRKIIGATSTRFKLRVLAGKFSKFTPKRLSPVVVGTGKSQTGGPNGLPAPGITCVAGDQDGDLLTGQMELSIGTDPCLADTDLDKMSDGWEFWAAKDLNLKAVPYPGKRPFPNALDPGDAATDYDGDSLPAGVEYRLWRHTGSQFDGTKVEDHNLDSPLAYSDGTQTSRPAAAPAVPAFRSASYGLPFSPPAYPARHVMYPDGVWSDDERDGDADGLNNFVETRGPGLFGWWTAYLESADWPTDYFGVFTERPFADLDPADPDVDGDTLLDGEDDQDNDDVLNFDEMYDVATPFDGFVKNAFNPCAPNQASRTCPTHPPFD